MHNVDEFNKMINKTLGDLEADSKHRISYVLLNNVAYIKHDCEYHVNNNSQEIESALTENNVDLMNTIKLLSNNMIINIDRIHKIIHPTSYLIGPPLPEKSFIRLRVNFKSFVIRLPADQCSTSPNSRKSD